MSADLQISVDREKCVGAGQCVIRAAEHFELDDIGYVVVLAPATTAPGTDPDIDEAVGGCPSGALSWGRATVRAGEKG